MKSSPRFEEKGRNCWKEKILQQSLVKDLKRCSFLEGNSSKNFDFHLNFILLHFVCFKFSLNF